MIYKKYRGGKSIRPILKRKRGLRYESKSNVNNVTMFSFGNTILLRSVRTSELMKNSVSRTKITKFIMSIFTSTISV